MAIVRGNDRSYAGSAIKVAELSAQTRAVRLAISAFTESLGDAETRRVGHAVAGGASDLAWRARLLIVGHRCYLTISICMGVGVGVGLMLSAASVAHPLMREIPIPRARAMNPAFTIQERRFTS